MIEQRLVDAGRTIDRAAVGAWPLFSSGTLSSLQFLEVVLWVEREVGGLGEDDLTEENFDTVDAIERLMARRRATAVAG